MSKPANSSRPKNVVERLGIVQAEIRKAALGNGREPASGFAGRRH